MENITEVVSGNLGKALEEVDKLLRNPRTRIEIVTLRRQMGNVTSELGKRTLDLYKAERINDPELAELCARIISIEARIAEREARLAIQAQPQDSPSEPASEPSLACPRCKTVLPQDAVFCFKCGLEMEQAAAQPEMQSRFCPQCGRELRAGANFCPRCGAAA
jgi:RNA polymerase subunit RPABC4/transcription elongation factor Spt4